MQNHELHALKRLRRWWMVAALFFAGTLAAGNILLSRIWLASDVMRWSMISALFLLLALGILWKNLHKNRNLETGFLRAHFGPGNWLSLVRGMLIALLAGFLFSPLPTAFWAWLPAILYTVADISDYFDGFLARKSHSESKLGEILDLEWDALGLFVAVSLSIWYGFLPIWFLPFGLARYLYIFGLWMHRRTGRRVRELPASASRRPIAAFTMGFMSVMLWPIVSQPSTIVAALVFAIPFTASFTRDWLVVTGRVDIEGANYKRVMGNLRPLFLDKFPITLRLLVILALVPELNLLLTSRHTFTQSFMLLIGPALDSVVWLFIGIETVSLIMIALGAAGRVGAFFLLIPLGLTISGSGLTFWRAAGLAAAIGIMIAGSGSWSLWKPEEKIFRQRAREKGNSIAR